jgi:serine/threonine protein kinase
VSQDQPDKLGRYEITGFLGKGAMGVVYEGRDPNIGRRVAIKTARRDVLETSGQADEMMERFLREARAAGALNHPNIVTVYDADEQDGTAYIAMEFIEGSDLQHSIEQKKRYAPEEVAEICATVCDALHHAHERGVVHRDVKPANIMLLPDNTVRVTDFGIARMADSTLTIDGAMIGTPHYMSPEQFMGQKVDGRSDLFSVGVIAYVLLTGERPFPGDALATVMHAVTQTTPIAPCELNFSISRDLNAVVLKALRKNPNQRYQEAGQMAAALREAVKENPNPALTLITPVPVSGTETLPGTAPFDDGATLRMQSAVDAASSATPAIDDDATIDRPPTPNEIAPDPAKETEAAAESRPGAGGNRLPLYAAAALLAVLAIAGYALFGGGGGGDGAEVSAGAANGYSVAPGEPHFSRLLVHAFLAPDEDYYTEKGQGQLLTEADLRGLPAAEALVSVTYPDGTVEELGRLPGSTNLTDEYTLTGRPSHFTLTLEQAGYESKSVRVLNPRRPGDIAEYSVGAGGSNWPFLLCPE